MKKLCDLLLECVCVREPQTAPKWGRCVKCPSPERPTSETMGTLSSGWRFRSYSTRLICSKMCKLSSFWNITLQLISGCLVIKNLILGDGCWIGNTQEGIGSQKLLFRCGGVFPSTRFYQIVGFPPGLGHHNLALVQHFVSALPKLGHQNSSRNMFQTSVSKRNAQDIRKKATRRYYRARSKQNTMEDICSNNLQNHPWKLLIY